MLALAALTVPVIANAGSESGQVISLTVRASDGLVLFDLSGPHLNPPACTQGHSYWIIKNENSETGKRQLAMLMAARASGATVHVSGANTCTRWPDGEDVDALNY